MKNFKSTITALAMGLVGFGAISISADEIQEKHVMVEIHKLSESNSKVELIVDENVQVFDLPSLDIGETKEIVTESGSVISVTKTESGVAVIIDGEEINLPAIGGDMAAHIMKGGMPLHRVNDGIQVIGDLTEEQIAIIDDAFKAAGVDKNVTFTQGNEMNFFLSADSDNNDLEHVRKWLSKDGENVKIIKMEADNGEGEVHQGNKIIVIEQIEEIN